MSSLPAFIAMLANLSKVKIMDHLPIVSSRVKKVEMKNKIIETLKS